MYEIDNYPQGHWQVGEERFISKHQACLRATELNTDVKFVYFDHIWENFDRSLIGKYSLQELYKIRAQQLRDSYDYLVLYFSGGADSWNVLRSFLDNGIHLDEVCVKWATDTINRGIYEPNTIDKTAFNYLSEWDYSIAPALEWLKNNHPQVKIEIVDWFKNREKALSEDVFTQVNHWHDIEIPSLAVWSPNEIALTDKGKRVGAIYGVDKPITINKNNKWYMYFRDGATCMGAPYKNNIFGVEFFYWSPKFPLLAFEGANVAVKEFKTKLKNFAMREEQWMGWDHHDYLVQIQQETLRHVLYDNWTDNFQANKPVHLNRLDKHWWLRSHELADYRKNYQGMMEDNLGQLSNSLLAYRNYGAGSRAVLYASLETKHFFVTD